MWGKTANKLIIFAFGALVAAMLVVGCGSSGETAASAPVTRAQVLNEAEEICGKIRDEREATVAEWEKKHGKNLDFDILLKQIVGPLLEEEAQALKALDAPAKDQPKLAKMTENLSKGAAAYTKEGTALKSTADIEEFKKEAAAYGLRGCLS